MNERQKNAAILEQIPAPPSEAVFKLRKVDTVVIPHPFVIGLQHLKKNQMHVDTSKPCAHCHKREEEHVAQKTLFIRVPTGQNLDAIPGLHAYLLKIKDKATALGIEGFAFPDKDPVKVRAWIAPKGQACFLNPPSHPDHLEHLEYRGAYGSGSVALSSVLEDEDGFYTDHIEDTIKENIKARFDKWEATKPAIDSPRVLAWMAHVYEHLKSCYKDDKSEVEPFEYGKPATLIFPVPFYKLRHFHDDARFSEEWRTKEQVAIKQQNDEIKARYAKVCTPENHAAVRLICKYYPEHQPRIDWIKNTPQYQGNWYETLETQPTPENCPGDVDLRRKHPVNGSWCQFCGWHEKENKS